MGKFDLDSILKDLGVRTAPGFGAQPAQPPQPGSPGAQPAAPGSPANDSGAGMLTPISFDDEPAAAPPQAEADEQRPRHTIDKAERAFASLPAVPTGQRSFRENITVDHDPAVPVAPAPANQPNVGQSLTDIYQPEANDTQLTAPRADLPAVLLATGAASAQQIASAQQVCKQTPGKRIAEVLIEQGCDELAVQQAVAQAADLPFERVDLAKGLDGGFDGKLTQRLTIEFCKQHGVLPLRTQGTIVVLGILRPDDIFIHDEVRRRLSVTSSRPVVISAFDLKGAMEIMGDGAAGSSQQQLDVNALLSEVSEADVQVEKKAATETDLENLGEDSPVIKYVNYIIQTAAKEGASDIHIEPGDKRMRVRFRIDGELYEMMQPPPALGPAIVSRLKIMANLDISERRLPQDGRIRCSISGRKIDLRVSTLPVSYGEKVVMRILDTKSINVSLDQLGFDPDTFRIWKSQIDAPHGIVLVTGPTGSGKTTTLYSSLKQLDKNSMNISTVEDPVEYHLDGITQCQTHDKIGMTFAKALKALLRQDPDVVLLGEIRDLETAITAVQAALTGHLVLSTLHTNDAPSSITRLVNIGIEPFLVGAALNAVLAQRLVRRLCKECKNETVPNESMADFLAIQGLPVDKIWSPAGCDRCRKTGYSGRVGLYELLVIDDQLRDIVARNPNVSELRRLCTERGMVNLRTDGLRKAAKGLTSVEEILRICESTI